MSHDGQNPYYNGGGGFVGGGGGSPYGSQNGSQGEGRKGKSGNATIRPVTVKQIINASQVHPDSDFTIDGVEVGQILLIGSIHNQSKSSTNVSYEIGDGTGYVDVRLWLDSADDEAGKTDGVEQDRYVGIMGTLKTFGGKRHVSATHIRPIENLDQLFHHLLKALYVSLQYRNPGGGGMGNGGAVHNDYNAGATTTTDNSSDYGHLPVLQRKIMEIVAAEDGEDGLHVSAVSRQVGNGVAGEDVMTAIEALMGDGLLFSTIDDLHIKAV